ncbi:MAG: MMPL family transporter [Proteobacteria bacterium]|nr:MMPL family transporter [Pseudomonadota bacterium]MDA1083654.1 MMPL family transporter [Pseudomonadota bacterium]
MKDLIYKYSNFVITKPLIILALVFLTIFISFKGISNFKLDASSDALVLEGDLALKKYRENEEEFGDSSFLIVTYEPNNELFTKEALSTLEEIEQKLSSIDGVDSVLSLLDAPIFFQPKVSLTKVSDNLKDLTTEGIDLELAKDEIINNPIYKDLIISADGSITAMQVVLRANDEYDLLINKRYEILDSLSAKEPITKEVRLSLIKELQSINQRISSLNDNESKFNSNLVQEIRNILGFYKNEATLYLGGPAMITSDMMDYIKSDLVVFGSAVALVFAFMLYLFFGNIWFVILPILNAFFTTFVTAGFLGFMDWKISVVSSNFIALLLILTISLTVHVLVKINELKKESSDYKNSLIDSVNQMFLPCFFAAITTAVAFLSLLLGDLKPVIEFGKMMAFGISIAFIFTFSFLPSAISLLKESQSKDYLSLHKITNKILSLAKNNSLSIYLVFASTFCILIFGTTKLIVENRFIDYFDEETEIHQGMLEIDKNLGGTATLDIIIREPFEEISEDLIADDFFDDGLFDDDDSNASGYWWNVYSLAELENIHDYLESLPEIGKVLSVSSGIKLARMINDGKDLNDLELALLRSVLPEDIRETLLYSFINSDDSIVRISTRVNESAENLNRKDLLEKISYDLQTKFNLSEERFEMTGLAVLYNNMLQSLFQSQIGSLTLVFSVIALMLLLIFKSFKIMVIGLIPNIFVASSVIGTLGLLRIPLDIMTITVAAISVGMAVDNTIHYIYRYKKEMKATKSVEQALLNAHTTTGRAIFYTAATIATGFSILSLSNFFPTQLFGIFTALAMLVAFISSLSLLPNLLVKFKVFQ